MFVEFIKDDDFSKEVIKMLSELTECTILMLKVIHEMYNSQRITYEEFVSHAEKKLKFLSENIQHSSNEAERRNAFDIIYKCNAVMSGDQDTYLQ